jgi:magnesium transporter
LAVAWGELWLDLAGPDKTTADALLRDTFGFSSAGRPGRRALRPTAQVDPYDHFTLMVLYGVTGGGQLVEVHCFSTETYLVTVHRDACPELTALASRLKQRAEPRTDHAMLLYLVVDTLIDGYFPVLADLDDRIDKLEDAILQRPTDQQLGQLFDMKRWLIALRKVVTPQRDMFATLAGGSGALPGITAIRHERWHNQPLTESVRI